MLWGGKNEIMLICYGCSSIDGEVRAAFSRRQVTKHFSAQLDIKMYSFIYESKAQSVQGKFSRYALGALRSASFYLIDNLCCSTEPHKVGENFRVGKTILDQSFGNTEIFSMGGKFLWTIDDVF